MCMNTEGTVLFTNFTLRCEYVSERIIARKLSNLTDSVNNEPQKVQ